MKDQTIKGEGQAPETSTPIVKPHATSMAVWDVPSPTAFNSRLAIKIGVSCSAGCRLTGTEVEVYDHLGARVARGVLGDNPWSSSGSLYWTEVELKAPGTEGYYDWTARFPEPGLDLTHEGSFHRFGFRTARQPEHTVTIEVTNKETGTPITSADIFLHPYRGLSDEHGMSRLMVPKGDYDLQVLVVDKQPFAQPVKVSADMIVKVELLVPPPRRKTYP
jgi:hypothetical protein